MLGKIEKILNALDINQNELAHIIGVTASTIHSLKASRVSLSEANAQRFKNAGINPDYIRRLSQDMFVDELTARGLAATVPRKDTRSESMIENRVKTHYEKAGGKCYKFISSVAGVPDRLVLQYVPEELRSVLAKYIKFIEIKALKKTARTRQEREIQSLRRMGFCVEILDRDPGEDDV